MSAVKIIFQQFAIVVIVCAGGFAVSRAMGISPRLPEMWRAAVIGLTAAEMAMIPVLAVRGKTADNVAQACLMATVIHMLVAAGGGILVIQFNHPSRAFSFWLCGFYAATLAGVCRVLLTAMKSAPVPTRGESIPLRQASET